MQTREAYKHYLSLKALTPCVFFAPWPAFRWWYHSEREKEALRIRGTTSVDQLISLFNYTSFLPSYSVSQSEADTNFMQLHMVSISPSLSSSQPPGGVSISSLLHFPSFSQVPFVFLPFFFSLLFKHLCLLIPVIRSHLRSLVSFYYHSKHNNISNLLLMI